MNELELLPPELLDPPLVLVLPLVFEVPLEPDAEETDDVLGGVVLCVVFGLLEAFLLLVLLAFCFAPLLVAVGGVAVCWPDAASWPDWPLGVAWCPASRAPAAIPRAKITTTPATIIRNRQGLIGGW